MMNLYFSLEQKPITKTVKSGTNCEFKMESRVIFCFIQNINEINRRVVTSKVFVF